MTTFDKMVVTTFIAVTMMMMFVGDIRLSARVTALEEIQETPVVRDNTDEHCMKSTAAVAAAVGLDGWSAKKAIAHYRGCMGTNHL